MSDLAFSDKGMKHYEWLLTRYPTRDAALLPTLRIAEEEFENLGPAELKYVADLMGISPAKVWGVFTFYTHYRREGTGTFHLQVCATLSCALRGADEVIEHIEERLGIGVGETTDDGLFSLSKVECLASCGTAPMLQCNNDYHEGLTLDDVDSLIDTLKAEAKSGGGAA
ncbi:MAG: NAD(P)H-dependent oxidoreductase subunit E [Planctomycetota bacterium]